MTENRVGAERSLIYRGSHDSEYLDAGIVRPSGREGWGKRGISVAIFASSQSNVETQLDCPEEGDLPPRLLPSLL